MAIISGKPKKPSSLNIKQGNFIPGLQAQRILKFKNLSHKSCAGNIKAFKHLSFSPNKKTIEKQKCFYKRQNHFFNITEHINGNNLILAQHGTGENVVTCITPLNNATYGNENILARL